MARSAELIARRALTVAVALSVLGTLGGVLLAGSTSPLAPVPGWYLGPVLATFAVLVLSGVVALWLPLPAVRVVAGVGASMYVVVLAGFGPALALIEPGTVSTVFPWALAVYGGPALAAVVAGGESAGLTVAAASLCAVPVYRFVLTAPTALSPLVSDIQTALSAFALCIIGGALVRGAIRVDALTVSVGAARAREAEIRERVVARTRSAAFIHDEVLVALRAAADGDPRTRDAVQRQAVRALALADRAGSPGEGASWIEDLRAHASALDPGIRIEVTGGVEARSLPDDVAQALVGAARQGVDNSVRHAGAVTRTLTVEADPDGIRIEVVDNGRGFDLASLPAGRLGISTSIVEALRTVAGEATVESTPGGGTRIVLQWRRGSAPADPLREDAGLDLPTPVQAFEDDRFERGVRVLTALFFLTQAAIAGVVGMTGGAVWVSVVLVAALALAGRLLVRARRRGGRGVALVTVLLVGVALGGVALAPAPVTYDQAWFLPAVGLMLGAVALRLRPSAALGGLVALLVGVAVISHLQASGGVPLALATARAGLLASLGALMAVIIQRARNLSVEAGDRAVGAMQERARDEAAQREIERRAADLDAYARPLLERLAAGDMLETGDRALARAVEGRLRDGYRAAALVREPLTGAVMAARQRGVDVVLLDDAGAAHEDAVCAAVAAWMAPQVARSREHFVGRLLPAGRHHLAHVVVDGRTLGYPDTAENPDAVFQASRVRQ